MQGPIPSNSPEFPRQNLPLESDSQPLAEEEFLREEEDFLKNPLSSEKVKMWLELAGQSFASIGNMKKDVKYYYDEASGKFIPSAEWVERKVSELKGKDSFISSYLGSAGELLAKALDVATWGAQGVSRRYYGEDWQKTIAGFEKIWSELYGSLLCVDELAEANPSSEEEIIKQEADLIALRQEVEVLKKEVQSSSNGMRRLDESYEGTEKGSKIKVKTKAIEENALAKIDETLEKLTLRIQELRERHLLTEGEVEKGEALQSIEFTASLPQDISHSSSQDVTELASTSLEREESVPPPQEQISDEENEEEAIQQASEGLLEKEEMSGKVEREKEVEEGTEKVDEEQSRLIHELEQLVDTPTPSVYQTSSSSNYALAKFDINGTKLKDVLDGLPRGVVLAMMVYVVNQWKIKKGVMAEKEGRKSYEVAKEIIQNLNINGKQFTNIVRDLRMPQLITLKTCLVNYYYTK